MRFTLALALIVQAAGAPPPKKSPAPPTHPPLNGPTSPASPPFNGGTPTGTSTACATDGTDYLYTETISDDGNTRMITTTVCPNHPYTNLNPNHPVKEETTYLVPAKPRLHEVTDLSEQGGKIGIAFSSTLFFSPYGGASYGAATSQATSATVAEGDTFDQCGGHAASSSSASYHYHTAPPCLLKQLGETEGQHSPQIGWAADGFPVYGPRGRNGELMKSCDNTDGTYGIDNCLTSYGGIAFTDSSIDSFGFRYHMIGDVNDGTKCSKIEDYDPYPGEDETTFPNSPTGMLGCCPSDAECSASWLPTCEGEEEMGFEETTYVASKTILYPNGLPYNDEACAEYGAEDDEGLMDEDSPGNFEELPEVDTLIQTLEEIKAKQDYIKELLSEMDGHN